MTDSIHSFNRVFLRWLEGIKEDIQNPAVQVISELAKSSFEKGMRELDAKALPRCVTQLFSSEVRLVYRAAFVMATNSSLENLVYEWIKNKDERAREALLRAAIHVGSEHFSNGNLYRFLSKVGCLPGSSSFKVGNRPTELAEDLMQCRGTTPEHLFNIHRNCRESVLLHLAQEISRKSSKRVGYERVYIQLFLADQNLPMSLIHFEIDKDPKSGELSSKRLQKGILKKIAEAMDQTGGIRCFTKKEDCLTHKPNTCGWKYRAMLPVELCVPARLIGEVDSVTRVLRGKDITGIQIKSIPFKAMATGFLMRINFTNDNCYLAANRHAVDQFPESSREIKILYPGKRNDLRCMVLFPKGERLNIRLNDLDLPIRSDELELIHFPRKGMQQPYSFAVKQMCDEIPRSAVLRTITLFNLALKLERIKGLDKMTGEAGESFNEPLENLTPFGTLKQDRLPRLFSEMKKAMTQSMMKYQEQDIWLLFRGWKLLQSPISRLPIEILKSVIEYRQRHDAQTLARMFS